MNNNINSPPKRFNGQNIKLLPCGPGKIVAKHCEKTIDNFFLWLQCLKINVEHNAWEDFINTLDIQLHFTSLFLFIILHILCKHSYISTYQTKCFFLSKAPLVKQPPTTYKNPPNFYVSFNNNTVVLLLSPSPVLNKTVLPLKQQQT